MVILIMGVSGVGKTTVGRRLAAALGWRFVDADDYHLPASVDKMRAGTALEDADRLPWLDALNRLLREAGARGEDVVLACSALKRAYRERLARGAGPVEIVYLEAPAELIAERLRTRTGHFMRPELLESQVATLEPPQGALLVDASMPVEEAVRETRERLGV